MKQILCLIFICMTLVACKTEYKTEEDILSDIFPELVDSFNIHCSNFIPFSPPPPPLNYNNYNSYMSDSIAWEKALKDNENLIKHIDSIDSRLIIGIIDSLIPFDLEDLKSREITDNSIDKILETNKNSKYEYRNLNFNENSLGTNFETIAISKLKAKYDNFWKIRDRKFGGLIGISKIYFDSKNELGIFSFEFYPMYDGGSGFYVIIEKKNKHWKIKRLISTWVA